MAVWVAPPCLPLTQDGFIQEKNVLPTPDGGQPRGDCPYLNLSIRQCQKNNRPTLGLAAWGDRRQKTQSSIKALGHFRELDCRSS